MNPAIQYFEQLLAQGIEKLKETGFSNDAILSGIKTASKNKTSEIEGDMWQEVVESCKDIK